MEKLCPPAAIFLVFMIIQISIDSAKGYLNSALMKVWVGILLTILLNYLCSSGLGIVSWLFIFIPFVLMTVIITVLLFMFGLGGLHVARVLFMFGLVVVHIQFSVDLVYLWLGPCLLLGWLEYIWLRRCLLLVRLPYI